MKSRSNLVIRVCSELQDTAKTIEIDTASLIVEEETYVSVTRAWLHQTDLALVLSMPQRLEEVGKRDDDELIFVEPAKTTQHLLLFTNLGNVIYRPIHELTDIQVGRISESTSVRP